MARGPRLVQTMERPVHENTCGGVIKLTAMAITIWKNTSGVIEATCVCTFPIAPSLSGPFGPLWECSFAGHLIMAQESSSPCLEVVNQNHLKYFPLVTPLVTHMRWNGWMDRWIGCVCVREGGMMDFSNFHPAWRNYVCSCLPFITFSNKPEPSLFTKKKSQI